MNVTQKNKENSLPKALIKFTETGPRKYLASAILYFISIECKMHKKCKCLTGNILYIFLEFNEYCLQNNY